MCTHHCIPLVLPAPDNVTVSDCECLAVSPQYSFGPWPVTVSDKCLAVSPQYSFGPWPIAADEVFAKTQLSYAFVNLKPIVPGDLTA